MRASRQSQPYRRGAREPGQVLQAIIRGRTGFGQNPQDIARATAAKGGRRPHRLADLLLRRYG